MRISSYPPLAFALAFFSRKYAIADVCLDRLENEHLGNMDQYRITREVPLPYSFDDVLPESDEDEAGIGGAGRVRGAKGAKKGR